MGQQNSRSIKRRTSPFKIQNFKDSEKHNEITNNAGIQYLVKGCNDEHSSSALKEEHIGKFA